MRLRTVISVLLAGPLLLTGCSKGDVSGDVFLPTAGGQAKRGADVEVLLVHVTDALQKDLAALQEEFVQAMEPVKKSHEAAKTNADAWRAEVDRLRSFSSSEPTYASWRQASDYMISEAGRVDSLRAQYRDRAVALFKQHRARSARTGASGGYAFANIPTGRVLVFAEWTTREPVGSILHVWLVPLDLQSGPNKLDLSASNTGGPFWRK